MVSFPWAPASTLKFGLNPQYFSGQRAAVEDLVHVHGYQGVLGRRDEIQVFAFDLVDHRPEVVQVHHPLVGLLPHHQGRSHRREPSLERRSSAYLIIDCSRRSASPFRKKNRAPDILAALPCRPARGRRARRCGPRSVNSAFLGSPKVLPSRCRCRQVPTGTDSSRMFGQPHQYLPDPGLQPPRPSSPAP